MSIIATMDQQLKQRLVGAAVLVAVAVIVLPLLLDDSSDGPIGITDTLIPAQETSRFESKIVPLDQAQESALPDPMALRPAELTAAEVPAMPEIAAPPPKPVQPAKVVVKEPRQAPAPVRDNSGGVRVGLTAWAVQLGSFSNTENALRLRDRLRDKGYTAFVETVYLDKGKKTRVFIGPELERPSAEKSLKQLEADMKMKGMVVRYPSG